VAHDPQLTGQRDRFAQSGDLELDAQVIGPNWHIAGELLAP
jgi:hypothetical protein